MNKRELRALKQEMQEPAVAVSGYRACSIGFGFGVESFYGGGGGSVGHDKTMQTCNVGKSSRVCVILSRV